MTNRIISKTITTTLLVCFLIPITSSARFISVDPKANSYPSVAPYVYTLNNPLKFVDPDGRKVRFAPGSSQQFKQNFGKAIQYMNRKGISGTFARLEKNKQTVYIKETKGINIQYDKKTKTITWNPLMAAELTSGGKQSPALILLHEGAHAERNLTDPKGHQKDRNTIDSQYDNKEEKRVIEKVETPAAKKAGEGTRKDHKAKLYKVKDPAQTTP